METWRAGLNIVLVSSDMWARLHEVLPSRDAIIMIVRETMQTVMNTYLFEMVDENTRQSLSLHMRRQLSVLPLEDFAVFAKFQGNGITVDVMVKHNGEWISFPGKMGTC
jgi:hypothetical protein